MPRAISLPRIEARYEGIDCLTPNNGALQALSPSRPRRACSAFPSDPSACPSRWQTPSCSPGIARPTISRRLIPHHFLPHWPKGGRQDELPSCLKALSLALLLTIGKVPNNYKSW